MAQVRPLNFHWYRPTLDKILEGYFIKDILLGGIGRPLRVMPWEDIGQIRIGPDSLVGTMGDEMALALTEAKSRGVRNVGAFHMGDERGDHNRAFYGDADYVIRNYWHEPAFATSQTRSLGVLWAPNGYRTGLGPIDAAQHLSIAQRRIIGFFAGAISGRLLEDQRAAMLRCASAAKLPFTIMTTGGFGQGLGVVSYASWLSNARFALVPAGNSHETIRLYEALEAGAIPIMVRSAFVSQTGALGALGIPPFILLDSWDGLAEAYAPFADAGAPATIESLENMRRQVVQWWTAFKQMQRTKIRNLIDRSFERVN